MDREIVERLLDGHIDVPSALERTAGNEELLIRLLKKFADGDYYEQVCLYLDRGDLEEAEKQMHRMKGVVGNLSMDDLFDLCCDADQSLKAGNRPDNLEELEQAYRAVMNAIAQLP